MRKSITKLRGLVRDNCPIVNGGTSVPAGIGAGDRMYVTSPGAAKPGGTGPIRINFAVADKALSTADKPEWLQIFQPMTSTPVNNVQIPLPPGTTIPGINDRHD